MSVCRQGTFPLPLASSRASGVTSRKATGWCWDNRMKLGRGDDTVGNPHRAKIYQFELFELILLSKLDRRFPVERFAATVSQSTVPSPRLKKGFSVLLQYE